MFSKVIGRPLWTMDSDAKQKAQYAEAFRRYTKEEFILYLHNIIIITYYAI